MKIPNFMNVSVHAVGLGLIALALNACGDDKKPPPGEENPAECIDANTVTLVGGIHALTTTTGLGNTLAGTLDGSNIAKIEINSGCGLIGTADMGSTLETLDLDMQDDPAVAVTKTQEAIAAGVVAMVGIGNQTHAAAQVLVQNNMPVSQPSTVADTISRCTAAQLADPAVTKQDTPVFGDPTKCFDSKGLFVRFVQTGFQWGSATSVRIKGAHATFTRASQINIPPLAAIGAGFKARWTATGGTFGSTVVASVQATQADFSGYLKTAAANDPEVIQLALRPGAVKALFEAYVALKTDGSWTKPAGFDNIFFINDFPILGEDFSTLSVAALAVAHNQFEAFASTYDENSAGFQAFLPIYQEYKAVTDIPSTATMRGYDAMMVLGLALAKANSTEPTAISAAFLDVVNPPGTVIYPGEFKKARELIMAGEDIDYEGTSSGGSDINEQGNATKIPFGVYLVSAAGVTIEDRTQIVIP